MHHDIQVAANTGGTDTLRRVMQTFVHRVTITGRDKVEPTFVIPGPTPTFRSSSTSGDYGTKGSYIAGVSVLL